MVGDSLIAEMSDTCDKGMVAAFLRPIDRRSLSVGGVEHMIRLVLDHIVSYGTTITTFGARFHVDVCHFLISSLLQLQKTIFNETTLRVIFGLIDIGWRDHEPHARPLSRPVLSWSPKRLPGLFVQPICARLCKQE